MKIKLLALIVSAFTFFLAVSCTESVKDPVKEAVSAEITKLVGEGAKVSFSTFELKDSTTLASEIEHRRKVMTLKLQQDEKLASDYASKGMTENSAKHVKAAAKDKKVLEGLEKLSIDLEPRFDETVYYDYKFSGTATLNGAKTVFTDYWASVSPEGVVLSLQNEEKSLHKNLSSVIPGFRELFNE